MSTIYILTINIEPAWAGTKDNPNVFGGNISLAGHMWYSVAQYKDGALTPRSEVNAGYTSDGITGNDPQGYTGDPAYTRTIQITEDVYNSLSIFGRQGSALALQNGFGPNQYNFVTNSCVDYVYKALDLAGLNPAKFQGDMVPMNNKDNLDVMLPRDIDPVALSKLPHAPDPDVGSTITPPSDSPTRHSEDYINDVSGNDHMVELKNGGTVWDAYVLQKNSAHGFGDWNEFKTAVAASNPDVADLNHLAAGTSLMLPEKFADGSVTYNYTGGTSINNNAVTGEYHMVVQNEGGGQTVYSRVADGDAGYVVRQVSTDVQGNITREFNGYQDSLSSDVKPISADWKTDTESGQTEWNDDGSFDTTVSDTASQTDTTTAYTEGGQEVGSFTTEHQPNTLPSSDAYATVLQKVADQNSTLDDQALVAAEIRAVAGAQDEDEDWGGGRVLDASDSELGDYYWANEHDSEAATQPWHADKGQDSLGLADGFDMGNGASVWASNDNAGYDWYDAGYSGDADSWTNPGASDAWDGSDLTDSVDYSEDTSSEEGDSENFLPVVLDMDGDGVELVSKDDSLAWFEVSDDGLKHKMGWVGEDDAMLVIDANHNGQIDQAKELSLALWSEDATDTDMQALKTVFDSNQDGVFDNRDERFADFQVWQDANGDGVTDEGELQTLTQAGIASIDLMRTEADLDVQDNHVTGFARYTSTTGVQREVADVGLRYDVQGLEVIEDESYLLMLEGDVFDHNEMPDEQAGEDDGLDADSGVDADYFLPVALDMDGDGVELVAKVDSRAWFDVKDDGLKHKMGWVGKDDALLVIDDNHNGRIDQAKELSLAMWSADTADTDMQALKTVFDSNQDGVFDSRDARFADFQVWQDANGDGVTDAGELKTLEQAGIASIGLTRKEADLKTGGNHVTGFASYTSTAGVQREVADVGLGYEAQGWKVSQDTNYLRMSESGGLVYGVAQDTALKLNLGTAKLDGAVGSVSNDVLTAGSKKAVMLQGGDGKDSLTGGAGDDWLQGDAGADTLLGGTGDDTLLIDQADLASGRVNGGAGTDVAIVMDDKATIMNLASYDLEAAVGGAGDDQFKTTDKTRVTLTGGAGNDSLSGGVASDILLGGKDNDKLAGGAGSDFYVFNRGDGQDEITDAHSVVVSYTAYRYVTHKRWTLFSYETWQEKIAYTAYKTVQVNAGGHDTLRLGADIDIKDVRISTSGVNKVVHLLKDGAATTDQITLKNWSNVKSRVEYVQTADGNSYAIGDMVIGTSNSNKLTGTDGDNLMNGGEGSDTMRGGAGNDTYVVDDAGDTVIEAAKQGVDTVRASVSYSLSANVENLTLRGGGHILGKGNAQDNVILGNAGDNVLEGGEGDDALKGGAGVDTLKGGLGDDVYVIDSLQDTIVENVNEGTDTVYSRVAFDLTSVPNVENLTLVGWSNIGGTGNNADNLLVGNSGDNVLNGGAGIDTLQGGLGDDTYEVDSTSDKIIEKANQGTDTVKSWVSFSLASLVNVENLTLIDVKQESLPAPDNGPVVCFWLDKNPSATGNKLNNVLTGNSGNNLLDGGGGVDTLVGGLGDDTYVVNGTTDTIVENVDEGVDTVQSSVTFSLEKIANLENLLLVGTSAINAKGNELDNKITGNAGRNVLDGGAGLDILEGGMGDDVYVVDTLTDSIVENANEGTDTVQSSVSFSLDKIFNLENLTLTGADAINATGNELNNILVGNSIDNVLSGGAGLDTLTGGAGADKFVMNALLNAKVNMDTITDFSKAQGDQIVLDKSIFTMLAGKTDLTNHFRFSKQAAMGGDDYIVYNATTGQLSYDASGSGSSTAVVFATLSNKPQDLTAQQFVVI